MKNSFIDKQQIGQELIDQLNRGYNVDNLSWWAYLLMIKPKDDPEGELREILETISLMGAGPEFEYSEKELRELASLLISNVKNPFEIINERRKF